MEKEISILLVDDHSVVRWGIRSLLEKNPRFNVCGEAENLQDTYDMIKKISPDIVLLDIKLPDGNGVSGCGEIKRISPKTKVIILTAYADEQTIRETVRAGADGYLLKTIDSKAIISSILSVYGGANVFDPHVTGSIINSAERKMSNGDSPLTHKEESILELLSLGKTNKEIARELFISEKTVRNYVSSLMKKINVSNRTEASRYWMGQKSHK